MMDAALVGFLTAGRDVVAFFLGGAVVGVAAEALAGALVVCLVDVDALAGG